MNFYLVCKKVTSSVSIERVKNFLLLQVFNASNVEIVTKTRTEHLLEEDKERFVLLLICEVFFVL